MRKNTKTKGKQRTKARTKKRPKGEPSPYNSSYSDLEQYDSTENSAPNEMAMVEMVKPQDKFDSGGICRMEFEQSDIHNFKNFPHEFEQIKLIEF